MVKKFMDIVKMMHDRMRAHGESLGLQKGFHRIIYELAKKGPKTQNELAELFYMHRPNERLCDCINPIDSIHLKNC